MIIHPRQSVKRELLGRGWQTLIKSHWTFWRLRLLLHLWDLFFSSLIYSWDFSNYMIESESSKIAKESIFRHKTFELHQKNIFLLLFTSNFLKGLLLRLFLSKNRGGYMYYYYLNGYQVGLEIASKTFFLSKPIKLYCFVINYQVQVNIVEIMKFYSH